MALYEGLIVEFRVKQVRGHRVAGFVPEDNFSSLRVVEVVRELGLITFERSGFGHGAKILSWRSASCPDVDHKEEEVQVRGPGRSGKRKARDRRDTRKGTKRRTERTNQTHDMDDRVDDMTRSWTHLSHCGLSHIMKHVRCSREKVMCEVYLSTHTVGYSRLLSAVNETYCRKKKLICQFRQESLEEECHLRYC